MKSLNQKSLLEFKDAILEIDALDKKAKVYRALADSITTKGGEIKLTLEINRAKKEQRPVSPDQSLGFLLDNVFSRFGSKMVVEFTPPLHCSPFADPVNGITTEEIIDESEALEILAVLLRRVELKKRQLTEKLIEIKASL